MIIPTSISQISKLICGVCGEDMVPCSETESRVTCRKISCPNHFKEQITTRGVTYEVVMSKTVSMLEEEGLLNLARTMRGNRATRQLILQRPNGSRLYFANEFMMSVHCPTELIYSKPFSISF